MKSIEKAVVRLSNWGAVTAAIFIAIIILLITVSVISRAFHVALPGTFDLVETLIVVGIAFALVYGQLEDRHLRADIAIERLKGRVRAAVESFLGVLNIVYWFTLLCAAIFMIKNKWGGEETTDILRVPVVPFRMVWVFALFLMLLLLIFRLIKHVSALIKGGKQE
ncbi:MAG TPA: TRAP transporter small permease [Syntrophorhabdaceae bacterium]|nr:TRAP transporter small permease [Syntrophorhabdaceae bacterium]